MPSQRLRPYFIQFMAITMFHLQKNMFFIVHSGEDQSNLLFYSLQEFRILRISATFDLRCRYQTALFRFIFSTNIKEKVINEQMLLLTLRRSAASLQIKIISSKKRCNFSPLADKQIVLLPTQICFLSLRWLMMNLWK